MDDDRFVVMGGIGFDAAMLRDADPKLKEHLGAVAYVLSGVQAPAAARRPGSGCASTTGRRSTGPARGS